MGKAILCISAMIVLISHSFSQSGWFQLNSGTNIWLEQMQFVNDNTGYIGSDGGFILKTTNAGLNWQTIQVTNSSQHYIICLKFFDVNTGILSGALGGNSFITTNGGISFDTISGVDALGMSFSSRDTGYINTKYQGIFKTTNGGNNWFNVLVGQYIEGQSSFTSNNTGYISRCLGGSLYGTILKTINGGLSWIQLNPDSSVCLLDVKFTDSLTGYCCGRANYYGAVVYKTTNGGVNWQVSASAQDCDFYSINFPTSNVGYVVSWYNCDKIIKTTNAGQSWTVYTDPLFNHLTSVFFTNENTGYAASSDGRIIKTTNGGTPIGIQPISSEVPDKFSLSQNYPNPFNPATNIKFTIPQKSFAIIRIYNVLGKEVITLVNESLKPGSYQVEWDGNQFASGVYFYELVARQAGSTTGDNTSNSGTGNFTETKKMVLIK